MKTIDIHGKPYIMVKDRVVHFNEKYPNGCIIPKMVQRIDNIVIFKATVIPDSDKPERCFTGHAEEEIGSTQINRTSALENCETSAVGRALAMMGIGVDESFASGDEVANAVFKQNIGITKEHSENVVKEATETSVEPVDGIHCPKCKSTNMRDNRDITGAAILSTKGQEYMSAGKSIEGVRGVTLPIYKCLEPNCGGCIFE